MDPHDVLVARVCGTGKGEQLLRVCYGSVMRTAWIVNDDDDG
ncbi:MAG TPA: hypothetical protein VLK84_05135 [Longimicrobium sp.]|nr:hypothetical protein [Longimicrobium sp.]